MIGSNSSSRLSGKPTSQLPVGCVTVGNLRVEPLCDCVGESRVILGSTSANTQCFLPHLKSTLSTSMDRWIAHEKINYKFRGHTRTYTSRQRELKIYKHLSYSSSINGEILMNYLTPIYAPSEPAVCPMNPWSDLFHHHLAHSPTPPMQTTPIRAHLRHIKRIRSKDTHL